MLLTEIVEKIAIAIDKKLHTISVFWDFERAFDAIDHHLLLKKLGYYGTGGIAYHWLSSYLAGRKHYVEIKNVKSNLMQTMCGVPQRSIFGAKLFLLYINDICNVSSDIMYILYTDDTSILCKNNSIKILCCTIKKN